MLCFSMSQYMLAFMVPSMNCSSPVPAALMQPQTMTLPPPCLTVGKTHSSLYSSPGCRHTRLTPSEPNKFILVSSDHKDMVPVIHVQCLLVSSKLFAGFLVHHRLSFAWNSFAFTRYILGLLAKFFHSPKKLFCQILTFPQETFDLLGKVCVSQRNVVIRSKIFILTLHSHVKNVHFPAKMCARSKRLCISTSNFRSHAKVLHFPEKHLSHLYSPMKLCIL